MPLLKSLDPSFPIQEQIKLNASPIILINIFTLDVNDELNFLNAWKDDAEFMKNQSGFISTQLHRAVGPSPTYFNYAIWESTELFRKAFTHPEFTSKLSSYPSSAVAMPHLFQKVSISGICTD